MRILRRDWVLIVAMTMGGLLISGLASVLVKPTYTSTTQLFVSLQNSGSVSELQQGNSFSQARVQSYVKTVSTPVVLQPVIDELGLNTTPDELAKRVSASTDLNTVLIKIAVEDNSPVQAAAVAQSIANSMVNAVETLEKPKTGGTSPVGLSVISPAAAPTSPSSPNVRMNLLLGLVGGLALAVSTAIVRAFADTRIRGEADLRRITDIPLLGGIAFESDAEKKPLLTQVGQQSPRAETYRQLRTNLQFANITNRGKSVIISSSVPGEGKSTTAINLAIALAQAGQSVCLVDADLRRPMVAEYLGLDRSAGLTTALLGNADINDLLQPWGDDSLYVLASGQIPPNPSELLGSEGMKELLNRLEMAFDTVIIDTPPLLPVTDAAVLSQHAGGVVVVVGSKKPRLHDLEKSLAALSLVDATVIGLVLNKLPVKGPDAYSYNSYSYESREMLDTKFKTRGRQQASIITSAHSNDPKTVSGSDSGTFDEIVMPTPVRPDQSFNEAREPASEPRSFRF